MDVLKRLVLASKNPGKLRELQALFADKGIEVVGLPADAPEVEETGSTFEENALIKARAAAAAMNLPALGEDSGIVVDALGGEPGIRSARWVPGSDQDRVNALLERMADVPDGQRSGRYVSVIALVTPEGQEELFRGEWEGQITRTPQGTGGFGYDPIFGIEGGQTAADLSMAEKNARSHRAKALAKCMERLLSLAEA